jgi:putative ABC transport system permease protein
MNPDDVLPYAGYTDNPKRYELAEGQVFHRNMYEAVIGSDVARLGGYKIGETFQATHVAATTATPADVHEQVWTVVGILKPTGTANDRTVWIPLMSFYTIAAHGASLQSQSMLQSGQLPSGNNQYTASVDSKTTDPDGTEHHKFYILYPNKTFRLTIDPSILSLSGVMAQSKGGVTFQDLQWAVNNGPDAMDVNPAAEMRGLLNTFLKPGQETLLIISSLVTVVAAIGILVSIYNSVSSRLREIAILRALGATRQTILGLICVEAGLIGLIGSVAGLLVAHMACFAASVLLNHYVGEGIDWLRIGWQEGVYLACVVLVAILAGLVPAMKAYQTPVATNLVTA